MSSVTLGRRLTAKVIHRVATPSTRHFRDTFGRPRATLTAAGGLYRDRRPQNAGASVREVRSCRATSAESTASGRECRPAPDAFSGTRAVQDWLASPGNRQGLCGLFGEQSLAAAKKAA